MSPPEVWGPAVWSLFHTLIEKMNPCDYPHVIGSMFVMIIRICKILPCPDCSTDASNFLAKIKLNDYKTKDEFKNMLYLFHNWVNAKKRKPLFNYAHLQKYAGFNLVFVLNNFIAKYNTKGNMRLLAESFQRSFVVRDLVSWFKSYARAFIQPTIMNVPKQITQDQPIVEEPTIEETPIVNDDQTIVDEEVPVVNIIDEIHSDKHTKIEDVNLDIQEPVVIEEPISIQQPKKKRTSKKKK